MVIYFPLYSTEKMFQFEQDCSEDDQGPGQPIKVIRTHTIFIIEKVVMADRCLEENESILIFNISERSILRVLPDI